MKRKSSVILLIIFFIALLGSAYFIVDKAKAINLVEIGSFIIIPVIIFVISLIFIILIIIKNSYSSKERVYQQRLGMWNSISYRVKKAGETAFNELPVGIIVIDNNFKVVWSNNCAKNIFMSPLENMNIKELTCNLYSEIVKLFDDEKPINFKSNIYGAIYNIEYLPEYQVIYLTDITAYENLTDLFRRRTVAIGYINVDNIEEALSDFDVHDRAEYQGKIMGCIGRWADEYGFFVRAYNEARYMAIMDYEQLQKVMASNFTILDDVKVLVRTTKIVRITLSIGISCCEMNSKALAADAQDQLELALTRGGDQAVVKIDKNLSYYGAKTDPVIKESKVDIRNKSQELQELMKSSSVVFAIGHRNLDADGFAGTLAIYRLARSLGKEAYIVFDPSSIDDTVKKVYDTICLEYHSLQKYLIHPNKVEQYIDTDSLLMIVDCQTEQQLADTYLVKKFNKIGIIDHHRKGSKGIIENPRFYYAQTAASSSVELIIELIEFCDNPLEFSEIEATWLLLGIVVDTNNFVYRTSSRTFEAAATLDRYGADMGVVKKYLKEEHSEKLTRADFVQSMEVVNDIVAIAVQRNPDIIYDRATLAKVSDELISISGIELGITVGMIGDKEVGMSARSLGMLNCQIIMEKMGGGGHLNNAAAQFKKRKIEDVVIELKHTIKDYFDKELAMKIILIKDVKGLGKKSEIVEVLAGYGNHILREKLGIIASPENIKALEREKEEETRRLEREIEEKRELKGRIEKTSVIIPVKVGVDGKMFGSVSTKQIADTLEEKEGIVIDKRKIQLSSNITSLGTFEVAVQLHKDVIATLVVHVVEK